MNTNQNLQDIIRQNLAANVMEASGKLPTPISLAQRNLADMYLDHLKQQFGDEQAQAMWSVPQPIFISHPAYTEINLVNASPVALGANSNSWLRVVYYSGRIFTQNRVPVANTDWIEPALAEIFGTQPHVIFHNDDVRSQFTGLTGTWQAVDRVLEQLDSPHHSERSLRFYGAVAATEYYQNHSMQKLYFVYHDVDRVYLVDAYGWGQGTPGCHRLVGFSIEALGFYQNAREEGLAITNPQTNQQYNLAAPLSTGLTSVWLAPVGLPTGVYAYRDQPANVGDWQYSLTAHTPGDVPKTSTGSAVAEEFSADPVERRERVLELFVQAHEGKGQKAYDYGLLVTVLSRQVSAELLRDVFIDEEGSLVIDVGLGPAADERFTFRTWRGETQENAPVDRAEPAVEEAAEPRRDDGMELLEAHAVAAADQPVPTSTEVVENYIKPKLEEQKGSLFAVGASSYLINLFDQFVQARFQGDVDRMSSIFAELKVSKIDDARETTLFDLLPELELAAKIAIDEAKPDNSAFFHGHLSRNFMLAMQGGDLDLMERLFPQIEAQAAAAKAAGAPQKVIDELESMVHNCRKNIEVVKARRDELENNLKDLGIEKPE